MYIHHQKSSLAHPSHRVTYQPPLLEQCRVGVGDFSRPCHQFVCGAQKTIINRLHAKANLLAETKCDYALQFVRSLSFLLAHKVMFRITLSTITNIRSISGGSPLQ